METNKIPILAEAVTTYSPKVSPKLMPKINRSEDVPPLVLEKWEGIWHYESAYVLLMNMKNCVMGMAKVGQGGISMCIVDIKLLLQTALTGNATNVILMHNHPSGNMKPSREDDLLTDRVKKACDAVSIQLLDHIIIDGDGMFYSYADSGNL